jgi:tubulin---tyrosine ligase
MYILITCVNGCVKGYWYEEGYVRTTSKEYNLKNLDNKLVHLTNDAIQKKGEEYGKFEGCNKVSLSELERYIEANSEYKFRDVYEKIKGISTQLIESICKKINPHNKEHCFEVDSWIFRCLDWTICWTISARHF